MTWPAVNAGCDYSPAVQTKGHGYLEMQDLAAITESEEAAAEGSLFISDIWALSHCNITLSSAGPPPGGMDYNVSVKLKKITKIYGFYSPYNSQEPIEATSPTGQQYEFTVATADLGYSSNWVVCKVVKSLKARCNSSATSSSCELDPEQESCGSGKTLEQPREIEIEVLRKVGVLRTDFCGEMLAGVGARGNSSTLRRIHALFV